MTYDLELVGITKGPKPIPAPADVAAPPKGAKVTKSGLASKLLTKGTGAANRRATRRSRCTTPAGRPTEDVRQLGRARHHRAVPVEELDPRLDRRRAADVVGEKRRFWIPVDLAYNDKPGKPKGMLVFDVELLSFTEPPKPPPMWPRHRPTEKRAPPAWCRSGSSRAPAPSTPHRQRGRGALHRLDHRRQAVRQLGRARDAAKFP